MKLLEYLKHTSENLNSLKSGAFIHAIMGNESCDLDSMVSSIVLAFYYSTLEKYKNIFVIPIISQTSKLFPIRVENIYLLEKYNIPREHLIYRDSLAIEYVQSQYQFSMTLVDHHILSSANNFLKPSVTEIIDHRSIDSSEVWDEHVQKDIQLVGSCCTLIGKKINDFNNLLSLEAIGMLYDVITYDTIGYLEEAGKVKPLDLEIAEMLEKALSIEPNNSKLRSALFDEIYNAHRNIDKLTTEQLLYKDMKVVGNVYIPGLPMLVESFLRRCDAKEALAKFSCDNNTKTVLVMGLNVEDGNVTRDIAIYSSSPEERQKIEEMLVTKFEAERIRCDIDKVHLFHQRNYKLSRKQLTPLLKLALSIAS